MRKLLIKTSVLAALLVGIMTVSAFAAEIGTGVVNASSLRLRSEPTLSSSTIAYIPNGTVVSVEEQLDGWYKVIYNGMTGYVSADYLVYTPASTADEPVIDPDEPAAGDEDTASQPQEEMKKIGTISGNNVNFRTEPTTASEIIGKFAEGTEVEVVSVSGGWCEVVYNGKTGYVSGDYVEIDGELARQPRLIVIGSCVNVRSGPGTDRGIVTKVYAGAIVELIEKTGDWYYISYKGYKGYISADYVREYRGNTASAIGEQVVALALSYLGVPYVWGGESPSGFDCSGFTLYIYKQFGYSLYHSASAQWQNAGEYVDRNDLQLGDMVFFADPSRSNGKTSVR